MKTILVPIDFSDASFNSANYAASLANIFNAELILVHAYLNPGSIDEMPRELFVAPGEDLQEIKERLMEEDVEILRKKFTVKIKGTVKEGIASQVIETTSAEVAADLIVMGVKGKGKSNSIFGSTTNITMRKSHIPVLVIPEETNFHSFNTITLASDFTLETQFNDYRLLKNIAERFDSTIQIVNVRKKNSPFTPEELSEKLNISHSLPGIKYNFYTIEDDDVEDGIEDFLDTYPSSLLVMVARKRNFFERLFGKSNTKEMSKETDIPLLVLQDQ